MSNWSQQSQHQPEILSGIEETITLVNGTQNVSFSLGGFDITNEYNNDPLDQGFSQVSSTRTST
jgi:hypothetical protein